MPCQVCARLCQLELQWIFFFFACPGTVNLFIVCFYHLPGGMYTHTATRKEFWSPTAGSSILVPITVDYTIAL